MSDITHDALAAALLQAVPGYGRWLSWPAPTANEARFRVEAMKAEADAHAAAILAYLETASGTPESPRNHGRACWEQGCTDIPCWRLGCEHHDPTPRPEPSVPPPPAPGLHPQTVPVKDFAAVVAQRNAALDLVSDLQARSTPPPAAPGLPAELRALSEVRAALAAHAECERTGNITCTVLDDIRAALAETPGEPREDNASEYGRLLAERDRLIEQGADPAELDMPLEPHE